MHDFNDLFLISINANYVNYGICHRLGVPTKYTPPRLGNKGQITDDVNAPNPFQIARDYMRPPEGTSDKSRSRTFFFYIFYSLSYTTVKSVDDHPSLPVTLYPTLTDENKHEQTNKNVSIPTIRRKMLIHTIHMK